MFRNYLKIFLHSLTSNKLYAAINIIGLGIGLACFILIALFVQHELGYEHRFANADRIYRVSQDFYASERSIETYLATMAAPAAPLLKKDFPQIEQTARISLPQEIVIGTAKHELATEHRFVFADPEFFELFNFKWLEGNAATALAEPMSVVLPRSTAQHYFGNANPVGETLLYDNEKPLKVTGVIDDAGDETHLAFGMIASTATMGALQGAAIFDDWGPNRFFTYVLLRPDANIADIKNQSGAFYERHVAAGVSKIMGYAVTPLKDIHLRSNRQFEMREPGSAAAVYIFITVAGFILFIACINFMNLTASRLMQRSNEIGMRKVVGASRSMLVAQLLVESVLLSSLALLLGVVLVEILQPWFSALLHMNLMLDIKNPLVLLALVVLAMLTGMLAGLYPALYLSGFKPSGMLKGLSAQGKGLLFRKALVVVQFAISIVLLIAMAVVYRQMEFVRNVDLGYDKDQVVVLSGSRNEGLGLQWEAMKRQLLSNPQITSVTASDKVPSTPNPEALGFKWAGHEETKPMTPMWVDYNFFETYGMQPVAGRTFSADYGTDRLIVAAAGAKGSAAYVINERLARELGWSAQEAVGKELRMQLGPTESPGPIVGVVKDVVIESVRTPVKPLIYIVPPQQQAKGRVALQYASIRISGRDLENTLAFIDATWRQFLPNQPVARHFLDQDFAMLYAAETLQGQIFALFSLLAIVIACLGLYGLAAINAELRTKEIGVRKVLGGSVWSIVVLLTNDFSKLVLIANVLAWPVAWYAMHNWLQNFALRIDLTPLLFVGSGLIALCIAWVTVGGTAAKAASMKPVLALRYE